MRLLNSRELHPEILHFATQSVCLSRFRTCGYAVVPHPPTVLVERYLAAGGRGAEEPYQTCGDVWLARGVVRRPLHLYPFLPQDSRDAVGRLIDQVASSQRRVNGVKS